MAPRVNPQTANPEPDSEIEKDDDEGAPEYKREAIGPRLGDVETTQAQTAGEVMEKLDADDMVPLNFPRKVMLQDAGIMHTWEAGVHLVPVALAGKTKDEMHWYLKAHKVKRVGKVIKNEDAKPQENAPAE